MAPRVPDSAPNAMAMTEWVSKVIIGKKIQKGHRSYDSALRDILNDADLDEEELVRIAEEAMDEKRKEQDQESTDEKDEKDGTEEEDNEPSQSLKDLWDT